MNGSTPFSKEVPFLAAIKERRLLTSPNSSKETWHVVLDLQDSGLRYEAGDCLGVLPTNAPEVVNRTLEALGYPNHESLREFLTRKANVTDLNSRLLRTFAARHPNAVKRQNLETLLQSREELKIYLSERQLWDFLAEHPEVSLQESEIIELLQPLLPRFYSIASAQRVVGDEVHLLIRHIAYTSREIHREGVCTHFICHRVPVKERAVPVFVQPSHSFRLPSDSNTPIIMVGPGTGVAPYRAFLQTRRFHNHQGRNWLFFGDWNQEHDFFYREFWQNLQQEGFLQLHTAFSRDQKEKIYVQHRMLEHASQIWDWLQQGAYFYVCGDAKRMARDVDAALHQIVVDQGNMDLQAARQFVRELRRSRRYLADVY